MIFSASTSSLYRISSSFEFSIFRLSFDKSPYELFSENSTWYFYYFFRSTSIAFALILSYHFSSLFPLLILFSCPNNSSFSIYLLLSLFSDLKDFYDEFLKFYYLLSLELTTLSILALKTGIFGVGFEGEELTEFITFSLYFISFISFRMEGIFVSV